MVLIGTIIVTVLVICIVGGACVIDLIHNPCNHPRKFVVRRFLNWFLVGITYASTYFGRYNMNVANHDKTYEELQVSSSQFGWVISTGSFSYAVFVVVNGFVVDKIGGSRAMVIGAMGSGIMNIFQGLFATFNQGRFTGWAAIGVICSVYAINNFFQTFCTSAICKVAVNWYNVRERGYFSGVFGVIISLGFYFAYQINGVVYGSLHWSWIFFIPAIQLLTFACLNWAFARNTPAEAGFDYDPITLRSANSETSPLLAGNNAAAEAAAHGAHGGHGAPAPGGQKPSLWFLFKTVFGNPIFIVLCTIDICLGWNRDGVLAWYPEVLGARFGASTTSNQYALASGGITIGGMFGSLSAGMLSDGLFKSRRTPVAFLFYVMLAATFSLMLFTTNSWVFAILIAVSAIWFNGLNGLITSTCAMDFAGSAATATAVGLLDGIQKIGSSTTGFMSHILAPTPEEGIKPANYQYWIFGFLPPAALAIGLLITVLGRQPPAKKPEAPNTLQAPKQDAPVEAQSIPSIPNPLDNCTACAVNK